VESSYLNVDMCKLESSQKQSRGQLAEFSKTHTETRAFNCIFMLSKIQRVFFCICVIFITQLKQNFLVLSCSNNWTLLILQKKILILKLLYLFYWSTPINKVAIAKHLRQRKTRALLCCLVCSPVLSRKAINQSNTPFSWKAVQGNKN